MAVDPIVGLVEAGVYTMVEVLEAVAVQIHTSDSRYQDCYCDPNIGRMGHKDPVATLAPNTDTSNAVVVEINTKVIEVLQTNCFVL